jgi:putative peptidoglycan lipid II flippase
VNAGLLYAVLLRRGRFRLDRLAAQRLPRIVAVCALTGAAIWLLGEVMRPWMKGHQPEAVRLVSLALLCGLVVAFHLAAIHLMKAADLSQVRAAFRAR